MGSVTFHSALIATPVHATRQRLRLWGAAAASAVLGMAVMPVVVRVLEPLHQVPHWQALEHALALAPRAAWLVMLLCLLAIAACAMLVVFGSMPRPAVVGVALTLCMALFWYVHLPAAALCDASAAGCQSVQTLALWALCAALSAVWFAAIVHVLARWHWVTLPHAQADVLDHYRYGK